MFAVGFGSNHGSHGQRQIFGCVILKWHITHLMAGVKTNVVAFSNVAQML